MAGGGSMSGPRNVVERAFDLVTGGDIAAFKQFVAQHPNEATKVRLRDGETRTFLLKAAEHSRWDIVKFILTLKDAMSALHVNARDK